MRLLIRVNYFYNYETKDPFVFTFYLIVTSYRPGARFGPSAIREGSRRTIVAGGYNVPLGIDPFNSWAKVVDCGDLQLT